MEAGLKDFNAGLRILLQIYTVGEVAAIGRMTVPISKSQKLIVLTKETIIVDHDPNKLTAYSAFSKTRNTL